MYYNKHKLYYPDPYVSGGSEGGGGDTDGGGEAGPSGSSGGAPQDNTDSTMAYLTSEQRAVRNIENPFKYIDIYDRKNWNAINPNGENRAIIIQGSPNTQFSLTLNDSSGCSILRNKIEWISIPANGKYIIKQQYPSITVDGNAFKKQETYTLTLTPEAAVGGPIIKVLTQTADITVKITKATSQSGPALTVGGGIKELSGPANTIVEYNPPKTYTLTITGSDTGTAESLYVKNAQVSRNITSNNTVKKTIDRGGETGSTRNLTLKPLTTRRVNTNISGDITQGDDDYIISGDLEVNMVLYAKVEHTKTVKANLNKDGDVLDYLKCNTYTNKFQLDNTHDLTTGMSVVSDGVVLGTYISSIDCDKNITLTPKQIIKTDTTIKFKQEWRTTIKEIKSNIDSKGNACITVTNPINIPDGTEVEFTDPNSSILTTSAHANSGSDSITLTTNIHAINFGEIDAQYSIDLDEMITSKPNAYNQKVTVTGDKATAIRMLPFDKDLNAATKTGTVVNTPKHGSVASYDASNDYFVYTSNTGFVGEDLFTFTMSDGVNTSDEKTIRITVTKPLRTGGSIAS